ncbi:winged helix-turn-helix transcriptional regulator [Mycobacterium sp. 1164966.3]|uniref:winged helix-turn-helix transcriptional regulator n=1 Tax=Mycobacterium sp. 1164966.3 TaxID=1856861 RepID=UPI000AABF82E|nr:winged helix-turn-helix transcriptional regulator [Mycobacterium sp. 1164966.3]
MTRRSYSQYCGLARALDLVGERWMLLIVRDLAIRPRRFGEILDGLPGLGTSLLSERLKNLEDDEIVERAISGRGRGGVVYRLTARGQALARALQPLAAWGATFLDPTKGDKFSPDWLFFAVRSAFHPEAAAGVHDCYEFCVDNKISFWVTIDDGDIHITQKRPRKPDFTLKMALSDLGGIASGQLNPQYLVEQGRAKFRGDAQAAGRALALFGAGRTPPLQSSPEHALPNSGGAPAKVSSKPLPQP